MNFLIKMIGVKFTYALFYIITIILLLVLLGITSLLDHFDRQFFEGDLSLSYYNKNDDQVTVPMLYLIILTIPIGTSILLSLLTTYKPTISDRLLSKFNIFEVTFLLIGFFAYALLTTGLTTEILKVVISRPRPSAYYLCNYLGYADAVNSGNYTNYNLLMKVGQIGSKDNCYDDSMISEAFSSFPSGHTSMSFSSMLSTAIIIRTMLNVKNVFTILGMLSYAPLIISAWIAVTRVQDNKHHEDDVFSGAFIGIVCTVITWESFNIVIKKINDSDNTETQQHDRIESGPNIQSNQFDQSNQTNTQVLDLYSYL